MISFEEIISNNVGSDKIILENTNDHLLVAKSINALMNGEGGVIYIGINKKNKITGIYPKHELIEIKNICNIYGIGEIVFFDEVIELKHKLVLKLTIKESVIKPQFIQYSNFKELYILKNELVLRGNHIIAKMLRYRFINGEAPQEENYKEENLFTIIKRNPNISLNKLYKISNLPKSTVDYLLVRLLNWKIVDFYILKESCYFFAK